MPVELNHKLKKIRSRGNLGEKVYQRLKEAIVKGDLPPGAELGEAELCEALGISRTPLREAFNRLKAEGLIVVAPRRGARVVLMSEADVDQLSEVREALETDFFARSAKAVGARELLKMQAGLREAEAAMAAAQGDPKALPTAQAKYLAADRAFHDRLIQASGNQYWLQLYYNIRDRIEICGFQVRRLPKRFAVAVAEHHAIIEAILQNDYAKAKRLMAGHIRTTRESMIQIMRAQAEETGRKQKG